MEGTWGQSPILRWFMQDTEDEPFSIWRIEYREAKEASGLTTSQIGREASMVMNQKMQRPLPGSHSENGTPMRVRSSQGTQSVREETKGKADHRLQNEISDRPKTESPSLHNSGDLVQDLWTGQHSLKRNQEYREESEFLPSNTAYSDGTGEDEGCPDLEPEDISSESDSEYSQAHVGGTAAEVSGQVKEAVVDRLMDMFYELFDEFQGGGSDEDCLQDESDCSSMRGERFPRTYAKDASNFSGGDHHLASGTGPPASTEKSSESSSVARTSGVRRKRQKTGHTEGSGINDDDNGDDESGRSPQDMPPKDRKTTNPSMRLACPFVKRFPAQRPKPTSCLHPGFASVARLKEHLYRIHLRPIMCLRCRETFKDESSLWDHANAEERCSRTEAKPEEEGLSQEQERMLRSKKRLGRGVSDEARWIQVYRICFPDVASADIPSPYHDPPSKDIQEFDQFQKRRLPELVRRELNIFVEASPQLAQLQEEVKNQIIEVMSKCQSKLYEEFRGLVEIPSDGENKLSETQYNLEPDNTRRAEALCPPGVKGGMRNQGSQSSRPTSYGSGRCHPAILGSANGTSSSNTSHGSTNYLSGPFNLVYSVSLEEACRLNSKSNSIDSAYGIGTVSAHMQNAVQDAGAPWNHHNYRDLTVPFMMRCEDYGEGPSQSKQALHFTKEPRDFAGAVAEFGFAEENEEMQHLGTFPNYGDD